MADDGATTDPVTTWRRLLSRECDGLRHAAAEVDDPTPARIAALRRDWSAELVHAALQLAEARRRAAGKFGSRAADLVADPVGVQMASSLVVARHKARRFLAGDPSRSTMVLDCCCGIGGDAMALAEAGVPVRAIDADPLRAWMAGSNAGCEAVVERIDAGWVDRHRAALAGGFVHIDPERRDVGRGVRRRGWHELQPPAEVLSAMVDASRGAAIKLAPGIAHDEPPAGELEFISEGGTLTQAVLWTGSLDGGRGSGRTTRATRATRLEAGMADAWSGAALSLVGTPGEPVPVAEAAGRFVFTVDPAPERAGLLAALCDLVGMPMLHPALGLLTGDALLPSDHPHAGWLTAFELLAEMAWNRKRVAAWLAAHDGGIVEVKTRGQVVDPNEEQLRLRGKGSAAYTVFVLRFDRSLRALVGRRVG